MESITGKFQIKRLGKEDVLIAQKLNLLFEEVFEKENAPSAKASYLMELLEKPDFIAYAAIRGNEIIGGLTAYELPMYYFESIEIFIYDIAVKPEFQRKGLGKKLLSTLNEYGRQIGAKDIFVDASKEDEHAVDFYRTSGGKGEKVVQFTYYCE